MGTNSQLASEPSVTSARRASGIYPPAFDAAQPCPCFSGALQQIQNCTRSAAPRGPESTSVASHPFVIVLPLLAEPSSREFTYTS